MMTMTFQHQSVVTPVTSLVFREVLSGEAYVENGCVYRDLPFDRWDEVSWSFVHATGRQYWDGEQWWDEYEVER